MHIAQINNRWDWQVSRNMLPIQIWAVTNGYRSCVGLDSVGLDKIWNLGQVGYKRVYSRSRVKSVS